eukprot:2059378-Rhodomonas_salina.4
MDQKPSGKGGLCAYAPDRRGAVLTARTTGSGWYWLLAGFMLWPISTVFAYALYAQRSAHAPL